MQKSNRLYSGRLKNKLKSEVNYETAKYHIITVTDNHFSTC